MKLSELKINPDNPQKFDDLSKLEQSIKEFPKMMTLRPLVVDADNMVLGGNKRLICLQNLGYKEIPEDWVKKADELTTEEQRRFIIADNVGFGEWDWDVLSEWDEPLDDWGLDLPDKIDKMENGDTWVDMGIKQSIQVLPKNEYIIIVAKNDDEWAELQQIMKCETVRSGGCKIGSSSDKVGIGIERVFNIETFKNRVGL